MKKHIDYIWTDKKSAVNVKIILSRKTAVVISKFILSE